MTLEQFQKQLISEIEKSHDLFRDDLTGVEEAALKELLKVIMELEVKNGQILNNAENLKKVARLRQAVANAILSDKYIQLVQEFVKTFDTVAAFQNEYFQKFGELKAIPAIAKEITRQAKKKVVEDLMGRGLEDNVIDFVQEILRINVTSGGSIDSLMFQLAEAMTGGDDGEGLGRLSSHAKTTTIDAINQFSAEYNMAMAEDLNWEWYQYVGSLLETSRQWCEQMVAKRYVHRSELPRLVEGYVNSDGSRVKIYDKTGLPQGMIAGTDKDNVRVRRGGYRCGHQFYPIPASSVPEKDRQRIAA